jgi:hypothetical protein
MSTLFKHGLLEIPSPFGKIGTVLGGRTGIRTRKCYTHAARQNWLANRTTEQARQVGILVVAAVIELLGRIEPNGPLGACTTTGL